MKQRYLTSSTSREFLILHKQTCGTSWCGPVFSIDNKWTDESGLCLTIPLADLRKISTISNASGKGKFLHLMPFNLEVFTEFLCDFSLLPNAHKIPQKSKLSCIRERPCSADRRCSTAAVPKNLIFVLVGPTIERKIVSW